MKPGDKVWLVDCDKMYDSYCIEEVIVTKVFPDQGIYCHLIQNPNIEFGAPVTNIFTNKQEAYKKLIKDIEDYIDELENTVYDLKMEMR